MGLILYEAKSDVKQAEAFWSFCIFRGAFRAEILDGFFGKNPVENGCAGS